MKTTFHFPPSVQSDLFNYLKLEQQNCIRTFLRVLKKSYQVELCCALLDYLETGEPTPPQDITLAALFHFLTRTGSAHQDIPDDPRIIRPLHP